MNDRLITAFGLIVALYLAFVLMMPQSQEATLSVPTSEDTGDDGYAALFSWLSASGITTRSWRQPWTDLADATLPAADGNVMLTTVTHWREPPPEAIDALRDWLEAGNTLVIAAALNDTPAWSTTRAGDPVEAIRNITDVTLEAVTDDDGDAVVEAGARKGVMIDVDPLADHPLMTGISSLRHVTVESTQFWRPVLPEPPIPLLKAAIDHNTGAAVIWERTIGAGSVIVVASATLLSNRMLGLEGNAKLVENLLEYRLGTDGTWLFDDRYQGLIEDYDADILFDDSRFWDSVLFLLAGWFIYMLGGSDRLLPPRERTDPPRQIDFVRAMGGLMARKLRPADAADQLLDQWSQELGIPGTDPAAAPEHTRLWSRLAATPTLPRSQLESLQQAYTQLRTGKEKSLVRFFNLLHEARKSTG